MVKGWTAVLGFVFQLIISRYVRVRRILGSAYSGQIIRGCLFTGTCMPQLLPLRTTRSRLLFVAFVIFSCRTNSRILSDWDKLS